MLWPVEIIQWGSRTNWRVLQWGITSVQSIPSTEHLLYQRSSKDTKKPRVGPVTVGSPCCHLAADTDVARWTFGRRRTSTLNLQKLHFRCLVLTFCFSKSKYCYILSAVGWRSCVFRLIMTLKPLADLWCSRRRQNIILTYYSAKWPPAAFHKKNPKPLDHLYSEVIYSHERRGIQIRLCGIQTPCTPSRCVCVCGCFFHHFDWSPRRAERSTASVVDDVGWDWSRCPPFAETTNGNRTCLCAAHLEHSCLHSVSSESFPPCCKTLADRPRTHTYTCPVHTNTCTIPTIPNRSTCSNECAACPLFIGFFGGAGGFLKCQM